LEGYPKFKIFGLHFCKNEAACNCERLELVRLPLAEAENKRKYGIGS